MEHMHRLGTAHDHIAHTRNHEHIDALPYAVFQNDVTLMAVNTADEHALHSTQQAQVAQTFFHIQCHLDIVLFRKAIFIDELFQTMPDIVDHCRGLRRKGPKIPAMGASYPQGCHHDLSDNRRNARQNIAEPPRHQADHDIQDAVCRHCRQHLPINQL